MKKYPHGLTLNAVCAAIDDYQRHEDSVPEEGILAAFNTLLGHSDIADALRSMERTADVNMAAAQAMRDDMYHWKQRAEAAEVKLTELENNSLLDHLKKCSAIVESWPEWKKKGADATKFIQDLDEFEIGYLNGHIAACKSRPAHAADLDDLVALHAEVFKLREEIKGPEGFDTWKDAAIHLKSKFNRANTSIDYLTAMAAHHSNEWHKMDPITGYMEGWNNCLNATRPAPAAGLDKLVPSMKDDSIPGKNDSYIDMCDGWNSCRAEMLRKIEEAKK